MSTHAHKAGGFTLIEFIIALVVLGLGSALLVSFVTPTARSADPMLLAQSRAIATAYMDEILLRAYGSCSDPGASRGDWEEIDCYNNLNTPHPPENQFGNTIPALADYLVEVTVSSDSPAEITVTVAHTSGRGGFTLESLRGDY